MACAIHPRSRSISPASSIASSHASRTTSNGSAIEWDMIKQGNLVEISDFIKTGFPINKATATSLLYIIVFFIILVHSNLVIYKNDQGEVKYYITFSPKFCSCPWFLDRVNCRHYIAACILLGFVDENDREFIIARGRGRPKTARGALTR